MENVDLGMNTWHDKHGLGLGTQTWHGAHKHMEYSINHVEIIDLSIEASEHNDLDI